MNKEVRAIIVDGTEIMTSLTAVEIANRLRTYDDLKEENEELKEQINKIKKLDRMRFNMLISHYGILQGSDEK